MTIKIVDCCLFNGESMLLERLNYLFDVVDLFVIIESKETFSGITKPFYYLDQFQEQLKPFESKLHLIRNDSVPPMPLDWKPNLHTETPEVWWRECYQRNLPYTFLLKNFQNSPFILLGCDLDEIPRREIVQALPKHYSLLTDGCKLDMTMHYYSWRWVKKYRWTHPFVVNDLGLKQVGSLEPFRTGNQCQMAIPKAGWHCSYFMSKEDIIKKIEHFSHTEYNQVQYKKEEWIQKCMNEGFDLFNRGPDENMIPYNGEEGYPIKK
jgi:beta-1,4-mannosyl-glycoprotein beta-1,4-N-acetylglucosaminyltransferase